MIGANFMPKEIMVDENIYLCRHETQLDKKDFKALG